MKLNILKYILILSTIFTFTSCEDFFSVDTDNVLDNKDYIASDYEMYVGYLGIMTKVQKIGDKIIYITDTRGELLEPTTNTPSELTSLYHYNEDLTGNSYADPAPYYDVIIACNDYIHKMHEYKKDNSLAINTDRFNALISSTLRVKAWVYLTLVKIYGEAVWFDDPMIEKKDISQFQTKNLDEIISACKQLLDTGVEGIDGTLTMTWKDWVDPEKTGTDNTYDSWDYMTPEYFALYAELCLWSGDYQRTVDLLLSKINETFEKGKISGGNIAWMRSLRWASGYTLAWNSEKPYREEAVSAIIYDYLNNQTNSLLKHFGTEAPNQYLLAPSEAGRARFSDKEFNNLEGQETDKREGATFGRGTSGQWTVHKFRPNNSRRQYAYQDDVHIYIYRGTDLHFMLAEALNQLGRYTEASAIINQGIAGQFRTGGVTWPGFTDYWTAVTPSGTTSYPNVGVRGAFSLGSREFFRAAKGEDEPTVDGEDKLSVVESAEEAKMKNDLALLDEMLLEFAAEGRTYPAMIRIAKRYNDYNIIADRVCPKYTNPEEIRTKILNGGYFVKWNLK